MKIILYKYLPKRDTGESNFKIWTFFQTEIVNEDVNVVIAKEKEVTVIEEIVAVIEVIVHDATVVKNVNANVTVMKDQKKVVI